MMGRLHRAAERGVRRSASTDARLMGAVLLGGLALFAGLGYLSRGLPRPTPPLHAGPTAKLLEVKAVELGDFDVVSGVVAACDPGYERKLVAQGGAAMKVGSVARGTWRARVIQHVVQMPGQMPDPRCAELQAFCTAAPAAEKPAWQKLHADIGVDSGQAGFFDWRHFRSAAAVPRDHPWKHRMLVPHDPWYSLCCDVTLHGDRAGVIPYGAVASSGWGDGGYPLFAIRDEEGTVVGLRLVFMTEDELDTSERNDAESKQGEGRGQ